MAKKVNLDALIQREDFEVVDKIGYKAKSISTIGIRDLYADSHFYYALRKPDFQRESNEWDAERICSLIESFLDEELIPAIILWRNAASYTFVIDGAHRLGALIGWLRDDYGDGEISKLFYDGIIPDEQIERAEYLRTKIRKRIGPYSDYKLAIKNPEKVTPEIVERAKALGALAIQLQWVEGDARKAEASFFKINQKAAVIDKTELKLLKARRKPNGVATRAIIRSGKGHKYWSAFSIEKQEKVQDLANKINKLLFKPPLKTPVKTLDLPIGGRNLSAQGQALVLEFVNKTNDIIAKDPMQDDDNGEITINYLKKCLKMARRINSNHPSSLGLHPVIYFYNKEGQHKPASFFAIIDFLKELENSKRFKDFIEIRSKFEEALVEYDYLVQQIVRKYRGASASASYIKKFLLCLVDKLQKYNNIKRSIEEIIKIETFDHLAISTIEKTKIRSKEFTRERKSEIYIKEAMQCTTKCNICGGLLHCSSITVDHIRRKQNGGLGEIENAQLAHPYCNSTYKN